jgi:hypothetical protein
MADNERWVHVEWIGYAQPVGLVVTPPALLEAQCIPDANVAARQEELRALVGERLQVPDLRAFLISFLGWRPTDLREPAKDAEPREAVYLEEYKETLTSDFIAVSEGLPVAHVKQVANGVNLDEAPPEDAPGWNASEQTRFERLLRDTKIPVGLLSNGHVIRLVYAPRGETAGHVTFPVAAMTEVGGRPLLSAMVMLLGADRMFAVPVGQRLPAILVNSRQYQGEVSTRLAEQVLEALHILLRGLEAADAASKGSLLRELRREENRHELTDGLLSVILRLVFLLYAEDKGLMPGSPVYVSSYSVTGLFKDLRDDEARYPDLMDQRFGAWARLVTLFRLVFRGGGHGDFNLPRRHGELFSPDAHPFLEGRPRGDHFQADRSIKLDSVPRVSDGTVLGVLRKLLLLDGERLSYRALDVEQIGSVYESMMGFELEAAAGRAVALRPKHVVVDLDALLELPAKKRLEHLKENAECDVSGNAGKAVQAAETIDDFVVALSRRLSPFTQQPLPKGSLYLQPGKERRRSGSHYTPRSLTEPIVRATLEPMLRGLGPDPTPKQILELKVCDPAMGSGAFLVEACRFLGDKLKDAWLRFRVAPKVPSDEDLTLHARRVVAQRCLYGVDKNPMAVQLSKLSLWLFTLAKDHPFTFLDHALKCGDSLVGLTRTQIARFTWEDDVTSFTTTFTSHVEQLVQRGEVLRLQIHDLPDPPDTAELLTLNDAAEASLETARLLGHLTIAAFFQGGNSKVKTARVQALAARVQLLFTRLLGTKSLLKRSANEATAPELGQLNGELRSMFDSLCDEHATIPTLPFHWDLEFPEVFGRGRDGFDSFIGNPPYMGGMLISGSFSTEYLEWLNCAFVDGGDRADLVAYFLRRTFDLLEEHGTFGLITTAAASKGDTWSAGLRVIARSGGRVFRAHRSAIWEGGANVAYSVIHVAKGRDVDSVAGVCELDGRAVPQINSRLRPKPEWLDPQPLGDNAHLQSQGAVLYGKGFLIDAEERKELVSRDSRNAERIWPYVIGDELNTDPQLSFHRFAIQLSDLTLADARHGWPMLAAVLEKRVKPEREKKAADVAAYPWWRFWRPRDDLYAALRKMKRCMVMSRHTKHVCFAFLPTNIVFSEATVVFLFETYSPFVAMQSRVHSMWVDLLAAPLKEDFRYSPSDCFENFPFPQSNPRAIIPAFEDIGARLYEARVAFMKATNQGLTQTYNQLKDPSCREPEVESLRELHVALDRAVLDAYGWSSIAVPPYTAPETERERADFETFEDEVLDKLFALNAERAALERNASAPPPRPPKAPPKSRGSKKGKKNQAALDLDGE